MLIACDDSWSMIAVQFYTASVVSLSFNADWPAFTMENLKISMFTKQGSQF